MKFLLPDIFALYLSKVPFFFGTEENELECCWELKATRKSLGDINGIKRVASSMYIYEYEGFRSEPSSGVGLSERRRENVFETLSNMEHFSQAVSEKRELILRTIQKIRAQTNREKMCDGTSCLGR